MIVSELKDGAVYSTEIKPSRWRLASGIIMLFFAAYIWFHPLATMVGLALYLGLAYCPGYRIFGGFHQSHDWSRYVCRYL